MAIPDFVPEEREQEFPELTARKTGQYRDFVEDEPVPVAVVIGVSPLRGRPPKPKANLGEEPQKEAGETHEC